MTSNDCLYFIGICIIKKNEISLEKPPITTSKKREFYHVLKLEINSRLLVFVG